MTDSLTYVWKATLDGTGFKALLAGLSLPAVSLWPLDTVQKLGVSALAAIAIDTITGFWAAYVSGTPIKSYRLRNMATKVIGYGALVAILGMVPDLIQGGQAATPYTLGFGFTWIVATEFISILENIEKMGIKLPKGLVSALKGRIESITEDK